jgi:hypothetical protein
MHSDNPISARTSRFFEETVTNSTGEVQAHTRGQSVHLTLPPAYGNSFVGQLITFTLLNLLVRLDAYCPAVTVTLPPCQRHPLLRLLAPGAFAAALAAFFTPFPAAQRLRFLQDSAAVEDASIYVHISPVAASNVLSVWADGWIAYLNEGVPPDGDENAVGASVAAGFAAAEIFKRLLAGLALRPGLSIKPAERLVFSTYDYKLVPGPNPPLPQTIDIDGTVIVGLGGIGVAFIAAAASLPSLAGKLSLVDRDTIDQTTHNRFLIARPGDQGFKVDLCRRALAFHAGVEAYPEWFDDFVGRYGDRHPLIVVGVDKDQVRRQIQAGRPKVLLNAGTSDTASFRVTRHNYTEGACLACIAQSDLQQHPAEQMLAQQLGLDLATVLAYRASGRPIPLEALQAAGVLNELSAQALGNRPLDEIAEKLCGQIQLAPPEEAPAVSISFLSALPGFLLLGEVIKERCYPQQPRPALNAEVNHAMFSVLGRLHPALLHGWMDKREGCDCTRPAYQRAYRRKWPEA